MRNIEIENCATTNERRKISPVPDEPVFPLRLLIGLKPDKNKAGYAPDKMPTTMASRKSHKIFCKLWKMPLDTTVPANLIKQR